ncbi:MAG: serine O-acetyltransferase [Clostridiales bacterium]|nr:serine O-acetyltransferase [Clostridiales bacterium]
MPQDLKQTIEQAADRINRLNMSSLRPVCPSGRLPDRERIIDVTIRLRNLLFPGFYDAPQPQVNPFFTSAELHELSHALREECRQAFAVKNCETAEANALRAVDAFVGELPGILEILNTDVEALFNGDPAADSPMDVIIAYPGLFAICVYRLAHSLYLHGVPMIPRIMTEYAHGLTGIDINAGATIGHSFFIDHGTGVVIGETAVIGNEVKLYQGVTLGALSTRKGQLLSGLKRHPTIGDRVTVYSNATILGGETVIGDDCLIGANAFITQSVPAGTRVMGKGYEMTSRKPSCGDWENA